VLLVEDDHGDAFLVSELLREEAAPVEVRRAQSLHESLAPLPSARPGGAIGIDPEYADPIFVIFQRLHARDAYEGTGIELAMCRKVIEHHGGQIWLEAGQNGTGSTFRFTLPVPDVATEEVKQ
jgi:light-regulated signal transduction histidine kinase (bacteriophytochrome)